MRENPYYFYKGAIHIHSNLSDGTGDIDSITKAAKRAGLEWIIITDHNYYDKNEGIINGVYVIKGEEISPYKNNHYLVLGIEEQIPCDDIPERNVQRVREYGGFGFAAHPNEGMSADGTPRKNSHHCIPWTDKNIKPDGVEIWNWFSNWADNLDDGNIFKLAYAYLFKHKIITPPNERTLAWWDSLNNETKSIVPAIGGVDAHALRFYRYIIPITVFPYETCFKTVTNFIHLKDELSKDFNEAKKQILGAIKNGKNFIVNRNTYKTIPELYFEDSKGVYYCGETISLTPDLSLNFSAEDLMELKVILNGEEFAHINSTCFQFPICKSGKYRLEVQYKGKGFVYTNPFIVVEN